MRRSLLATQNWTNSGATLFLIKLSKKCNERRKRKLVLFLLKHSFDIIGISEHKITKGLKKSAFNIPGYTFCFNETKNSDGGTGFFVFNNLTYKLQSDLLINGHSRLQSSTVIELIFPNKENIIWGTIYKHPDMKISDCNNEYLIPLRAKILQEEKTCLLMGDFNINLLSTGRNPNVSDLYYTFSSNFFAP